MYLAKLYKPEACLLLKVGDYKTDSINLSLSASLTRIKEGYKGNNFNIKQVNVLSKIIPSSLCGMCPTLEKTLIELTCENGPVRFLTMGRTTDGQALRLKSFMFLLTEAILPRRCSQPVTGDSWVLRQGHRVPEDTVLL